MQTIAPELATILKAKFQAAADGFRGRIEIGTPESHVDGRIISIAIDKSLRMPCDQAEVVFENEGLPLGWGSTSLLVTGSQVRIYQWYGEIVLDGLGLPTNVICTFTGLLDQVLDARDPEQTTISVRDRMAVLIDQTFSTSAPQGTDEDGAVRTEANGVYLNREVSYIVSDILDRAGWPTADRDITDTSYVLDEFIVSDGSTWAETIIGDDALTGMTGYDLWADELGVIHFAPTIAGAVIGGSLTDPGVPVYTFRSGEDILSLADQTDQYDLVTRVKVRGPFITTVLNDAWTEQWRTSKLSYPVGIWYDPDHADYINVLDRGTKRKYHLRQSDRVILSSVYLGGVIPYPLGLSGDPSDSTIYWVLNAPWRTIGGTSGNSVKKVRKADNVVIASYALPNGQWSAIKVSGSYVYLTDLSTDRVYARSKATLAAVSDFRHVYGGVTQSNPTGIMVDGTTLHVFWANGGTTARFLVCDESDPATITKVIATAGTNLHGGEMNTTNHVECWGDSDSLHLTAKFTLYEPETTTTDVSTEVVDTDLEDELGLLAGLEDREHDTHPADADHPFEVRRATFDLTEIKSIAQATQTAQGYLARLGRRARTLDVGIVGNPALQKGDLIRIEDPITGIAREWVIDTYRTMMDSTYLGTMALLPAEAVDDAPDIEPPGTEPNQASVIQWSNAGNASTPIGFTVTMEIQPTVGDLLVAISFGDGAVDPTAYIATSGWTKRAWNSKASSPGQFPGPGSAASCGLWTKVVDGGTTVDVLETSGGTLALTQIWVVELAGTFVSADSGSETMGINLTDYEWDIGPYTVGAGGLLLGASALQTVDYGQYFYPVTEDADTIRIMSGNRWGNEGDAVTAIGQPPQSWIGYTTTATSVGASQAANVHWYNYAGRAWVSVVVDPLP